MRINGCPLGHLFNLMNINLAPLLKSFGKQTAWYNALKNQDCHVFEKLYVKRMLSLIDGQQDSVKSVSI